MTNKEKLIRDINNFTTDELADFLDNFHVCSDCCSEKNHNDDCHHYCSKNIREWLNTKCPLQEGALVKIVDTGKIFHINDTWVLNNIDDKKLIAKYAYGISFYDYDEKVDGYFKVIKIVDDKAYIQQFYGWPDVSGGACYLFDVDGLEEIEEGE